MGNKGHEVATGMMQHERVVMARCPVGSSESCWQIDKVLRMVLYQRRTKMDVKKSGESHLQVAVESGISICDDAHKFNGLGSYLCDCSCVCDPSIRPPGHPP